jgi:hypothetical protein
MIFAICSLRMGLNSLISGFLILAGISVSSGQNMDNKVLETILESVTDSLLGERGMWQFRYNDREMLVITDEHHDRMRIISPLELLEKVTPGKMEDAMIANFHSVLDVRYAISENIVWAAFLHPLKSLNEDQVRDALLQVYRAAETYGTTFSSTELVFPGHDGPGRDSSGRKKKM